MQVVSADDTVRLRGDTQSSHHGEDEYPYENIIDKHSMSVGSGHVR